MANFNFNKVILGGRLTSDPELKTTQSGISVTSFRLAVNRRPGKDGTSETDFFTVNAWRGTAEFICKYFRKGSCICVTGTMQMRTWQDQQGQKRTVTEVQADEAFFVDGKNDGAGSGAGRTAAPDYNPYDVAPAAAPKFEEIDPSEELPF
jgi:single-strand DNA-binding protein